MATEQFHVVVLPHSRAVDAEFHVSLLIAPDLTPDKSVARLNSFTHFPHWPKVLRDASEIVLSDQAGVIACKARLDVLDTDLWHAVFPPKTPVRRRNLPDWSERYWRTFPAAEIHDTAKLFHAMAMFTDPVSPPAPSAHPLTTLLGRLGVETPRGGYDESHFTARFDEILGEGGHRMSLAAIEKMAESQEDPMMRIAIQLHRARRFYERPENQSAYQERPDEGVTPTSPPRPDPDFHERCALLADHPGLQRRLGLVIDLVADDPNRFADSQWLAATIVPRGDTAAARSPRTRCAVSGEDLVTVPAGEDWHGGRLRLGDVERYSVLDLDPDGSALKLERFLWTLPRLRAVERNGDPVHAAPTALRSLGFTVVRRRRAVDTQQKMSRQLQIGTQLAGAAPPLLTTEDVMQGLRVEVWDDSVKSWYSLHRRLVTAEVLDHGVVAEDVPEDGFIQGATATENGDVANAPVHVHEGVFGWEGWSLAAPKPGKRVRHEDGNEVVEDPDTDPDPVTPVVIHTRVEPGTLPRLRYGRSYAFRAWGVDLAGNVRPHPIGPPPPPPAAVAAAVSAAASSLSAVTAAPKGLVPLLRGETAAAVLQRGLIAREEATEAGTIEAGTIGDLHLIGEHRIEQAVLQRLTVRRGGLESEGRSGTSVDRASQVTRRFGEVIADQEQPFLVSTAIIDTDMLARAIGGAIPTGTVEVAAAISTVTPLRPFLRWDPVEPPAMVSRHRYTAGESLRQVVLRSGVTQDLETLEITVTAPADYAAAFPQYGYLATAERHLVPPKTSQSASELHGAFDDAIGSTDPADHARLLAVALRESGTLFDVDVVRLDDPTQRDPQPGIELANDPTVPPSELAKRTLPIPQGEAPVPGQYIIHDVDQLRLPYLPDVIGRGISLVFPEAGRDRQLGALFGTEGFTARWEGDWPERDPFRMVLHGTDHLEGRLDDTVLSIGLPPGDIQKFRLSSSLDRVDLDLLGVWRMLPELIRQDETVAEAAADGWMWWLTPFEDVSLVHAVPRPLEAPRPTSMIAVRLAKGTTEVVLVGGVDVHGPSTEQLTAEAAWVDPVDDLSLPAPENRRSSGIAFTTPIRPEEDLAVVTGVAQDVSVNVPGAGPVWFHRAFHQLGDTRHHTIRYRFRASTRFREYFDAEALTPGGPLDPADPETPVDDGQSVVGPVVELSVPSSAIPAAPIVHSVVPLFRWDQGTEPEQPVGFRRRRRAGVRIYLERPWYSSGEGELLGVVLAPGGNDAALDKIVSQWGSDPVWQSAPVPNRAMFLQLDNLLRAVGFDDRPGDALPVVAPATLPLATQPGSPDVTVLGYRPQYSVERGMWYVDVAIDPGSTFWPFVRLSVVRYQPDSIAGCHLSAPVRCDFIQLTPERTTSVARTDVRHVRVVVSGAVGVRQPPTPAAPTFPQSVEALAAAVAANRKVVARLQRRDPQLPTDLGWDTVAVTELVVRGRGRNDFEAAWVGSLEAPEDIPLHRPGDNPDWRVTVEEWERLPGDPATLGATATIAAPPPVWEQRLIYADEIPL